MEKAWTQITEDELWAITGKLRKLVATAHDQGMLTERQYFLWICYCLAARNRWYRANCGAGTDTALLAQGDLVG